MKANSGATVLLALLHPMVPLTAGWSVYIATQSVRNALIAVPVSYAIYFVVAGALTHRFESDVRLPNWKRRLVRDFSVRTRLSAAGADAEGQAYVNDWSYFMRVEVSRRGLTLGSSPRFVFRLPTLDIPWSAIQSLEVDGEYLLVLLDRYQGMRLLLPKPSPKVVEKALSILGASRA